MTTIIEKNPSNDNSGLAIILIVCVLMALGFGLAYKNGVFDNSSTPTIIERNNTTVEKTETVTVPVPTPAPVPTPDPVE